MSKVSGQEWQGEQMNTQTGPLHTFVVLGTATFASLPAFSAFKDAHGLGLVGDGRDGGGKTNGGDGEFGNLHLGQ